jgi:hypothetical protein
LVQNVSCIVLNTQLLSFHANVRNSLVDLDWEIANDGDALFYELERSTDNINYTAINKQYSSKLGGHASYSYTDSPEGAGNQFYRVKIVERNGHVKYSRIIVITMETELVNGFKILPNPTSNTYSLLISNTSEQKATIYVSDMTGRILEIVPLNLRRGSSLVNLTNPAQRQPGTYAIRLVVGKEVFSGKMIHLK